MSRRAPQRGWRRWLLWLVVIVVAVEVLYVLAANVFLNTGLSTTAINRKPEKILVEWDGGWTVIPGIARLWNIRLRGQQRAVQWYAELDSVTVGCHLLPLATKTFHAGWVRGRGLDFRLRQRPDVGQDLGDKAADLPPIPGFSDPPQPAAAVSDTLPRSQRKPWTIALDDVTIDQVEALWLGQYRFAGDGSLDGAMRFEIRGPLEVDGAHLKIAGDLVAGDEAVAHQLSLDIEARLERFVPQQQKGAEFFRILTASTRISAPRANLGFLDSYFRGASWLGLAGSGRVAAEIAIERGILVAGSWVTADEASFELDYLDYRAYGEGRIEGAVKEAGRGPEAVLDARLASFELRRRGAPQPHVRGTDLTFHATSPDLDLTETKPDYSIVLDLPPSEITDLRFYNSYLPGDGIELVSGAATIAVHLELSTERDTGSGDLRLEGKQIKARFGDLDVIGDLTVATHLAGADVEARRFDLSGSRLSLDHVSVGDQAGADAGTWWARFELPEGKVHWTEPLALDVRARAQVRDSRPIITLLAAKKPLLRWMKPLLRVQDLELALDLESVGESLAIDNLLLTGKGLEIRADLRVDKRAPRGFIFLHRGPLSAALELADGERGWKLLHARRWYEQQTGRSTRGAAPTQKRPPG